MLSANGMEQGAQVNTTHGERRLSALSAQGERIEKWERRSFRDCIIQNKIYI